MQTAAMGSLSHNEQYQPFRPDSATSTATTSKSKFHSLLHWRKSSNASLRPSTRASDQAVSGVVDSSFPVTRPPFSSRNGSGRSVSSALSRPRTAENQRSHKHDRMINDPPPLAQAYGQSLLHAQLETPTSFIEKSRYTAHDRKNGHTRAFSGDEIEVKRSHKRTLSSESTCSTQEKMFFLVNGPYILQYNNDSNGDAQPEKILILDQNSVAIACDAVPGRPWVLQVSRPHAITARSQAQTLKPSWSRMTLRQSEDRRAVNTLLLVFDDSEELYTWLFALRKEIEDLGGLEYRPNGEDDQTWRENLTRKFAGDSAPPCNTLRPSTQTSPESRRTQNMKSRSRFRTHSTQSSTSSKQTSTSLDRLRDSVVSDGCTSTLATSCADGSASSASPIIDVFPHSKFGTGQASADLFLRGYERKSDSLSRVSTSPKPSRSLLERRKVSVASLSFSGSEDGKENSHGYLPGLPSTITAPPLETPPQVVRETNNDSPSVKGETSAARPKRPPPRNKSAAGSNASVTKAKYSLFPACPPPGSKNEVISSPPSSKPLPIPEIVEPRPTSRLRARSKPEIMHQKSKSRTLTLELRQHRVSALLGAGELIQPQRSPRVTDEMIMFNFGVAKDEAPASPIPEIRVPDLSDLAFDMDFLKMPYKAPSDYQHTIPVSRRPSSTRNTPRPRHERSPSLAKAPVGPPPTGPLPEVPIHSRQPSRTGQLSYSSIQSQDTKYDQRDTVGARIRDIDLPTTASLYSMLGSGRSGRDDESQVPEEKKSSAKTRTRSRSRGPRKLAKSSSTQVSH